MLSQTKIIQNTPVPALGFGTWDLRGSDCEKALESALDAGYRHIDTAEMYANEDAIGNVLRRTSIPRNEFFITTKVWPVHYDENDFFKAVEQSLKSLNLAQVDLLLLHWPKDEKTNIQATEYLLECFNKGYAKHIGVSNFDMVQLKQAQKQAPIFCNQVKYHPHLSRPGLVTYMQDKDLLITSYSPLKEGIAKNDKDLAEIGKKYGKTASQVALRWLVQQENVTAIPKAASRKHQAENLDIFDFELDEAEMKSLANDGQ